MIAPDGRKLGFPLDELERERELLSCKQDNNLRRLDELARKPKAMQMTLDGGEVPIEEVEDAGEKLKQELFNAVMPPALQERLDPRPVPDGIARVVEKTSSVGKKTSQPVRVAVQPAERQSPKTSTSRKKTSSGKAASK